MHTRVVTDDQSMGRAAVRVPAARTYVVEQLVAADGQIKSSSVVRGPPVGRI